MTNESVDFDPFAGPLLIATAPTTSHQREIWTACQLGDDASLAYNESIRLALHGPLDVGALERAFETLVARHDALRSSISSDGLTLCVAERAEGGLETLDLSALDEAARKTRFAALLESEVETTFDLARSGLFRAFVVLLGAERAELVFTAHHIVCDGWSSSVLVQDWAALYSAEILGHDRPAVPKTTFTAYANSEAARTPSELSADQGYWLGQYQGELPVLDLPTDRARPPQRSFHSRREDVVFEKEFVHKLKQLSASLRSSLFATLLGGFQGLLARLTGQTDIIVGVPFAGQSIGGLSDLVGHAVNMLPLRAKIDPNVSFDRLVADARTRILDAQEHQNYTLGTLLGKLPIARDPSRAPLITATLNLDRGLDNSAIGFHGLRAELHSNPRHFENFEIFLNAVERDGTLELECQYATSLFDAATIRRWLDAYRLLLESAIENPKAPLGDLAWVPKSDVEALERWNAASEANYERSSCVDELVAKRAKETPNAIAIECDGLETNYADLDRRASQLAAKLVERGVGRGQFVGLCLDRTADLVVSALAIWKAGAAYVPLDPDYPAERLAFMVSDSKMTTLVTSRRLAKELELVAEHTVVLDDLSLGEPSPLPSPNRATPEDVAYVIYTSGSTGKPKGVMVPHRAVVNLLTSVAKTPGLERSDVVLAITTLSFDIAVSEIWLPLVVGAKIVLTTREVASDGGLLRNLVESRGITFIDATPATYRLLLGAGWQGNSSLKLICTGEAMPLDLARILLGCSGELWNGYGPTETTVWSSFWQAKAGLGKVLIGRPVDNTQLYVLDEKKRLVPIGVSGELYIGGDGVSHGYLNRPDLTTERFLDDPFVAGGRLYRTGDVARFLPSGDLECLGRNDHQVKLRGFRIELGEIEDALIHHPKVQQATVVLREDRPGEARLVGYLVAPGETPTPSDLRAHLKTTLPDYMVPAVYVTLPRMPLTPSGKIDRKALPPPDTETLAPSGEYVAPVTKSEELLAELWSKLLRMNRVSVEDDFFALGGHSLLASQIIGRLRRDHGIELSFRKFFEAPTIRRLAASIDARGADDSPKRTTPKKRAPGAQFPLSLAQERLYLLEEMHPGQRVVHNLPAAWEFRGSVNAETLERALGVLSSRHETLRTTFNRDSGAPVPRVVNQMRLPLTVRDLRSLPAETRRASMMEEIHADSHEPFDLEKGPLFRAILFRLEDELFVFYTLRHNIIWDGWSFDIFLGELASAYDALDRGEEPNLVELPIAYGDYALWQRDELKTKHLTDQVSWWERQLAGSPTDLFLPKDFPRKTQSKYAGGNVSFTLSTDQDRALTETAHRAGTTLFMVMFAAYTVALHRYSGQRDLLVGLPVRGRPFPDLENLIGPFTNTIVLRTELDPKSSFLDHLKKVRDRSLESFSHEEMPLEMLGARPPVVRALFSFQDARARPLALGSIPINQVDVEHPAAANDLMVWTVERHNKLVAIANYNSEIFEKSSIERFLRSFSKILEAVVENPTTPLDRLPILSTEDALEVDRVTKPVSAPSALRSNALLDRRAASHGSIPFVAQGGTTLDYATLRADANKIASSLRARGITDGDVVAVESGNLYELAATVFGAQRAGATVVALAKEAGDTLARTLLSSSKARFFVTRREPLLEKTSNVSFDELTNGDAPISSEESSSNAPAWLVPTFEADTITFSPLDHRTLVEAASSLSKKLALAPGARVGVSLGHMTSSLPLALTLLVEAGLSAAVADDDAEDTSLSSLLRKESQDAVFASAPGYATALADGRKFPRLSVVFGEAPETLLGALGETRVVVVTSTVSPLLYFADAHEPARGARLGHLLAESRAISVVDAYSVANPFGVVGTLVLRSSEAPSDHSEITLPLEGRLMPDGVLDAKPLDTSVLSVGAYRISREAIPAFFASRGESAASFTSTGHGEGDASQLVVYYEKTSSTPSQAELRRGLRGSHLPEMLVPQFLVEVERLARDANGNIDEARLPSPFTASGVEFVEPRSKNERLLARLFEKVLELPRVGLHDNFFELGGHSLLCLRVVAEIEVETGRRISPRVLLLNTLEQAARALDSGTNESLPTSGETPKPKSAEEPTNLAGRVLKGLSGFLKRS